MVNQIKNVQGERLDFTFHPGSPGATQLVVIGHGVTGHKDRPFLVALAEGLAGAGIPALRVSWSGNAGSEGRFADCTISKEVADLGAVLDACAGYAVTYVGHSMGGAVGVLRASPDRRIRRLISLAGMVNTRTFAEHHFGALTPGRDLMWGKPDCVLSPAYMDDLRRIGEFSCDGEKCTTIVYIKNEGDVILFLRECKKWKIKVERSGDMKFIIELPFHNYRNIPEIKIKKIDNNLDFF